jgi:Domain of unknown function (DUF3883)
MAINEWWAQDPDERYWLEITDREQLGDDLHAPQHDQSGRTTWSYELVRYVRDGDFILHWWKQPGSGPAIVGFSRAIGEPFASEITWQPHGTYGRASGRTITGPSWRVRLADYTELDAPVTLNRLRDLEPSVKAARGETEEMAGTPLYFPFALSDRRPLRTAQAYLTKMPLAALFAIPELNFLALGRPFNVDAGMPPTDDPDTTRRVDGQGRQLDAADRKAVERHAVDWALKYLADMGYVVEDVGYLGPYDIRATSGEDETRVEVKGSTGTATTVELTDGEVRETEGSWSSLLVVVDEIVLTRVGGRRTTSGGRPRLWWDWSIEEGRLQPTRYRYVLDAENALAGLDGAKTPDT